MLERALEHRPEPDESFARRPSTASLILANERYVRPLPRGACGRRRPRRRRRRPLWSAFGSSPRRSRTRSSRTSRRSSPHVGRDDRPGGRGAGRREPQPGARRSRARSPATGMHVSFALEPGIAGVGDERRQIRRPGDPASAGQRRDRLAAHPRGAPPPAPRARRDAPLPVRVERPEPRPVAVRAHRGGRLVAGAIRLAGAVATAAPTTLHAGEVIELRVDNVDSARAELHRIWFQLQLAHSARCAGRSADERRRRSAVARSPVDRGPVERATPADAIHRNSNPTMRLPARRGHATFGTGRGVEL